VFRIRACHMPTLATLATNTAPRNPDRLAHGFKAAHTDK
jgi:hypothetical protein